MFQSTKGSLSWADLDDDSLMNFGPVTQVNPVPQPLTSPKKYSDIVKSTIGPGSEISPSKRKRRKKTKRQCYTCRPRGKVLKHIIKGCESDGFLFHYDLNQRPLVLITPERHVESLNDLSDIEKLNLFKAIKNFCEFWKITDYQVSYNEGTWKTNSHFHAKIKINEKIINRMKRDHFMLIKKETKFL